MKCTQKTCESLMFCLNRSLVSGVTFRGLLGFFSVSVVAHSPSSKADSSSRNQNWKDKRADAVREEEWEEVPRYLEYIDRMTYYLSSCFLYCFFPVAQKQQPQLTGVMLLMPGLEEDFSSLRIYNSTSQQLSSPKAVSEWQMENNLEFKPQKSS